MPRNLYIEDEITLCTYLARFGHREYSEIDIHEKYGRSIDSIKMKVQNIASMLDEEEITRYSDVKGLSGVTTGESGRRTNWEWVKRLISLSKEELFSKCESILYANV